MSSGGLRHAGPRIDRARIAQAPRRRSGDFQVRFPCLLERQVGRERHEAVLLENAVIPQHAVDGAAHGTLMVLLADRAGDPGLEEGAGDAVARAGAGDVGPDLDHLARAVRQRDRAGRDPAPAVAAANDIEVAVVERGRPHADQNLVAGRLRIRRGLRPEAVDAAGVRQTIETHRALPRSPPRASAARRALSTCADAAHPVPRRALRRRRQAGRTARACRTGRRGERRGRVPRTLPPPQRAVAGASAGRGHRGLPADRVAEGAAAPGTGGVRGGQGAQALLVSRARRPGAGRRRDAGGAAQADRTQWLVDGGGPGRTGCRNGVAGAGKSGRDRMDRGPAADRPDAPGPGALCVARLPGARRSDLRRRAGQAASAGPRTDGAAGAAGACDSTTTGAHARRLTVLRLERGRGIGLHSSLKTAEGHYPGASRTRASVRWAAAASRARRSSAGTCPGRRSTQARTRMPAMPPPEGSSAARAARGRSRPAGSQTTRTMAQGRPRDRATSATAPLSRSTATAPVCANSTVLSAASATGASAASISLWVGP